jgi:succinoglycan biosynthesis protein ExoA
VIEPPVVSIIMPVRNEADRVDGALDRILEQDFPLAQVEVVVVDGASDDRTQEVVAKRLEVSAVAGWSVLENPTRTIPASLNLGLRQSSGQFVIRVDARSRIPRHYVARCVELLAERPEIVVVGGAQVAVPPLSGALGEGIARAFNNRFAMGMSRYRSGRLSGPSDTVYLGAFRRIDLEAVGGWNERFSTNQDFELNRRMSARGHVWHDSSLRVEYLPRATIPDIFQQYFRFGRWKVRYWRWTGDPPRVRQIVLMALPSLGLASLAAAATRGKRAVVGLVVAGAASAFVVESCGCSGPRGGVRSRLVSIAAMITTSIGWMLGLLVEAVRPLRTAPMEQFAEADRGS